MAALLFLAFLAPTTSPASDLANGDEPDPLWREFERICLRTAPDFAAVRPLVQREGFGPVLLLPPLSSSPRVV